ncbi:TetR/AcrR family transcriptional regulator [Polycladomyces subterraneus]|uniref:TetR/AcrR family transcriptional regulator n=1 Tax=Polycladomyces subterraneus TaxID=1016997 RepID=A0ABT8ILV9_9BACL|nr:TetR/AcrR family transcriptional regulator [Polycladomyces subterraneus]MDN4593174.1 TetR/AcrR family transcriptional regulator [Polycladomyces subterraneus]
MNKEHQTAVRQHILESTFRCLAENGSSSLSVRKIAQEADITLSLVHYYFPNKEELLVAAASYTLEKQLASIREELHSIATVTDRIKKIMSIVREQFTDTPWRKVYFDLLSMASWSPRMAQEVKKMQDDLIERIVNLCTNSFTDRMVKRAFVRTLLAILNGLALQVLNGAPEEEIKTAFGMAERAILSLLPQSD